MNSKITDYLLKTNASTPLKGDCVDFSSKEASLVKVGNFSSASLANYSELAAGDYCKISVNSDANIKAGDYSLAQGKDRVFGEFGKFCRGLFADWAEIKSNFYSWIFAGKESKLKSGDNSILLAGKHSNIVAGNESILISGEGSQIKSGNDSILIGQDGSELIGGENSCFCWIVSTKDSRKIFTARVGESGIKANIAYICDSNGRIKQKYFTVGDLVRLKNPHTDKRPVTIARVMKDCCILTEDREGKTFWKDSELELDKSS